MTTLSKAHRADLRELARLASTDLALLWPRFNTAEAARDGLMDVLPRLMDLYGSAAATLGADHFDEMRDRAGVRGRFQAIPAELPDLGRTDSLARWAVSPLFQPEPDPAAALGKVSGGLQRIIANADRDTVRVSSIQDRQARGWMRVGSPKCSWCAQFLDGEVHYTEGYGFAAHDDCQCTAEPVFG